MKVKNVHLPQLHPNGGFSDPLLEVCIAALVVMVSVVSSSPSEEPVCDIHISSCIVLPLL